MDKVSIIIPCFNYGKYLSGAIESALNQTHKNIEIIVVDDGSTDKTIEIAGGYSVDVVSQKNQGLSSARNVGIEASLGEWIYPLDADDKIAKNCIKELLIKIYEDDADIGCPGLQEFGEKSNFRRIADDLTLENFEKSNKAHSSCMYKKDMWVNLGGYDEKMKEGHEDWDFWVRALRHGYIMTSVNEPLFFYRIHRGSMIRLFGKNQKKNREYIINKSI